MEISGPAEVRVVVSVEPTSSDGGSTCLNPCVPPASGIGDTPIDRERLLPLVNRSWLTLALYTPLLNLDWEFWEERDGLSEIGGTGGGEGVRVGRGNALSLSRLKLELLPDSRPFNRWFALALSVLLLVGGFGVGEGWEFELVFAVPKLGRAMGFSVTTVSSIPVGAPTFFSAVSFECKYFASASNLSSHYQNQCSMTGRKDAPTLFSLPGRVEQLPHILLKAYD